MVGNLNGGEASLLGGFITAGWGYTYADGTNVFEGIDPPTTKASYRHYWNLSDSRPNFIWKSKVIWKYGRNSHATNFYSISSHA